MIVNENNKFKKQIFSFAIAVKNHSYIWFLANLLKENAWMFYEKTKF